MSPMPGDDDDDDDWENSEAKRQLDAGRDKDMVLSWKRRLQQAKALGFDVDDPAIIQQLLVAHNKAAPADGSSNSAAGAAAGAGFDQAFAASASATGVSSVGKANTAATLQQRGADLRSERSKGNKGAGRDGKSEGGSSGLFGGAGHAKKKSKKDSEGGEKGKDDKSTKGKDDGKAAAAVLGVFVLVSLGGLRVLWHQDIAAPRGEYEVLDRSLPKPASVSGGKVQLSKMKPQLIPGLTSTYPEPPGVPQPLGNELVYQFFNGIFQTIEAGFTVMPGSAGQLPRLDWVGGGRGDHRVFNSFATAQTAPGTDGPSFMLEMLSYGTNQFFNGPGPFERALRQSRSTVTILLTTARKAALANPSDTALVGASSTYIAGTNYEMQSVLSDTPIARILNQNAGNSEGPALVVVIEPSVSVWEWWKENPEFSQPGESDDDDDDNDDDDSGGDGGEADPTKKARFAASDAARAGATSHADATFPPGPAPEEAAGADEAAGDVKFDASSSKALIAEAQRKVNALKAAAEEAKRANREEAEVRACFARPAADGPGKSNEDAIELSSDEEDEKDDKKPPNAEAAAAAAEDGAAESAAGATPPSADAAAAPAEERNEDGGDGSLASGRDARAKKEPEKYSPS